MQKPDIVLVLGMHRAGTSALANLLTCFDCRLTERLMPPGYGNPTGFFEDQDLVDFNDKLLRLCAADWKSDLPPIKNQYDFFAPEVQAAQELLAKKLAHTQVPIILKDPRTARFLPFWNGVFEDMGLKVTSIICFRHPSSVADSLSIRDQLLFQRSLDLWLQHYLASIEHAQWPAYSVSYEKLVSHPYFIVGALEALAAQLGPVSEERLDKYIKSYLLKRDMHILGTTEIMKYVPKEHHWLIESLPQILHHPMSIQQLRALRDSNSRS